MIRREDFIHAMGMPDEGFTRAVDAALRQVREREARPVMKKKITLTLLTAVLAAIALAGAALAVGLNLFDYFGKYDDRLQSIAPKAALEDASVAQITTDALGATTARIDSAYYDGESLIVAYAVDSFRGSDRYEPTDGELSQMTEDADCLNELRDAAAGRSEIAAAFLAAVDQKKPFGIAEYEIAAGEPRTADGTALIPRDADVESAGEGPLYCIFEFETPLPEAARNRECLDLVLPVNLYASRHWFDGERIYSSHAVQTLAELTATVRCSEAP